VNTPTEDGHYWAKFKCPRTEFEWEVVYLHDGKVYTYELDILDVESHILYEFGERITR